MAYTNNIPNSTDLIANSQPQIKANFTAIDSGVTGTGIGFSRNHVTMTDATNGGLHNRVDFYQALSSPVVSGFIASAYPKTVGSTVELFYKNASQDLQLSGPLSDSANGYITLPGGFLLQWGSVTINNASSSNTGAFPTPFTSAIRAMVVTPQTNTSADAFGVAWNPNQGSAPYTTFTITRNGTAGTVSQFWIAIGK